jgi:hypothetical protein
VQAVIIIACHQYFFSTLVVAAQEAQVENPCVICPNGATSIYGEDYAPFVKAFKDPITCKEIIANAKLFEMGSIWCARYENAGQLCCPITPEDKCTVCPNGITVADNYEPSYNSGLTCADVLGHYEDNEADSASCTVWGADIESHCCPTVANNPCTICPDGATAGEDFLPYLDDNRTCKDLINAALTFDAESEMCLVWAKKDEYECCPSNTTTFNEDYCNICPNGITAGDDIEPWSRRGDTCKDQVEEAKLYENGSVGCNFYKGYEVSCCQGAGTDAENTPSSTPIPDISPPIATPETSSSAPSVSWAIAGNIASVVGVAPALVATAFAFA